ncbi:MAG: heavy metal translocating P-type ATPase [Rhodospirillales bacterium]
MTQTAAPELPRSAAPPRAPAELRVGGMRCTGCAGRLEAALGAVPGVAAVHADHLNGRATVMWAPDAPGDTRGASADTPGDVAPLRAAAEAAGFTWRGSECESAPGAPGSETRENLILAGACVLTAPLLASMILGALGFAGFALAPAVQLALAAPVQLVAGWTFYTGAWSALRARRASMDVLVTLGAGAAFLSGLYIMAAGLDAPVHFAGAAAVITFVLLGKRIEARAVGRAGDAVRGLTELAPRRAARVTAEAGAGGKTGGETEDIAVSALRLGDEILVRAGERLPADGEIFRGASDINEAHLTGEALPRAVGVGDAVFAGALNMTGGIYVRVTAVGADARLGETIAALTAARAGKSPLQRQADRFAAVFVPVVVIIAAITWAAWVSAGAGFTGALAPMVAVLIVSCPCALGLAAPLAASVGVSRAAKAGIFLRRADGFEALAAVDTFVFDKTGTLTGEDPAVAYVSPAPDILREDILSAATMAARGSAHPLARAVLAVGAAAPMAERTEDIPGGGMTAHAGGGAGGRDVAAGNAKFVRARTGLSIPETETGARASSWVAERPGEHNGGAPWQLLGRIDFSVPPRAGAAAAVAELRAMGLSAHLMSGDTPEACRAFAEGLGFASVEGGMAPADKAERIAGLRAAGKRVAMAGDGANDAPALAAADAGLAIGEGTRIAADAAVMVLARSDPAQAAAALRIARDVRRTIRWNLFWAFVYNAAAIPAAAMGALTPAAAGAAMAASSLFVVANTLRARRQKA